jgi:flagellar hook assembly protein FlgD
VITIDGLAYETDVKITDIAGQVVHSTTSNGGRVVWDGNDFSGARVSTGVYLVYCSNADGSAVNVARIAMVR